MPDERRPSPQALALLAMARPVRSHPPEAEFQQWYRQMADRYGLTRDPDAPEHQYDYRVAMMAGDQPDVMGHWPSQVKDEGHPTEVVAGFNTRTGQRVPGAPLAGSVEEMIILGWEPKTAHRLWKSVHPSR